jgi:hypothetical protein
VHPGSVLAGGTGWTITTTINPTTGEIAIFFVSITPIASSAGGSLVSLDFQALSQTSDSPAALVDAVNPTGQQVVTTELEDAQGAFTLTLGNPFTSMPVFVERETALTRRVSEGGLR